MAPVAAGEVEQPAVAGRGSEPSQHPGRRS
jgi:hypothetical protein